MLIDIHQEIDGDVIEVLLALFDELHQKWASFTYFQIGGQLFKQLGVVLKRKFLRVFFQKKVEWVDGAQFSDHFHIDFKFLDPIGENDAGHKIAKGVLLPIDEMGLRANFHRIRSNFGAGMYRGA